MAEARKFRWVGTRPIRHDGVDKVTGRASFGADLAFAGMLHGRVLRSPHAHAKHPAHRRLEGAGAAGREGRRHRAPICPTSRRCESGGGRGRRRTSATCRTTCSRATRCSTTATRSPRSPPPRAEVAEEALAAIDVEYEPLPPVLSIEAAMPPARRCCTPISTTRGADARPARTSPRASCSRAATSSAGFAEADVVVEREFQHADRPPGLHRAARRRGAHERRTASPSSGAAPRARSWCAPTAPRVLGLDALADQGDPERDRRRLRRQDHGLPRAARGRCSRARRGRPVKMVMTREEVFRATGPARARRRCA